MRQASQGTRFQVSMAVKKNPLPRNVPPPDIDPWRVVSDFAPYLRIAHQIPGRVRLKLDAAALNVPALREVGGERLKTALGSICGVHDISLNLLARSCVVTYDNGTIPDAAWSDLLAGRRTPAAATLLDLLAAAAVPPHTTRKEKTS
jgi:hypothetical protein